MAVVMVIGGVPVEGREIGSMEIKHAEASVIARKKVVRRKPWLEDGGDVEDVLTIAGRVVPFEQFSSRDLLDDLKEMRQAKTPQMVVLANGEVEGWYVVEKLEDTHKYISAQGVGRAIDFTATLIGADPPSNRIGSRGIRQRLIPKFLERWLS